MRLFRNIYSWIYCIFHKVDQEKIKYIIEKINEPNDILNDIQFKECNPEDNKAHIRTPLPKVKWKKYHKQGEAT